MVTTQKSLGSSSEREELMHSQKSPFAPGWDVRGLQLTRGQEHCWTRMGSAASPHAHSPLFNIVVGLGLPREHTSTATLTAAS